MKPNLLHLSRSSFYSFHDVEITGASTEVAFDASLNFFLVRVRVSLEQEKA